MSFSEDERYKAHNVTINYNISRIGTFTGNMGSGSGTFNVEGNVINQNSATEIKKLIDRIRSSKEQLKLKREDSERLDASLNGIQRELDDKEPRSDYVIELLKTIRNIAESVAGSFVAQGILFELAKFLK